ncbi:amino acid ABC transporter permease [Leptolyngbya ohadii]|uniref:amino acid ABC transporter permease n=1 Tax=Leptolyngbya ohadii TaxID=1962290 RepID=UPI000B59906A|nr:amino acid ABC transporter permease [Leptolyngbya ohadii]
MTTVPSSSIAPPPSARSSPATWIRKNFFSNWFNTLLTLLILAGLLWWASGFLNWAFTQARWDVIPKNMALFFAGRYPAAQRWRIWILFAIVLAVAGLTWGTLVRNTPKLLTRNVLTWVGVAAAITILLPVPTQTHIILLALEALLLATAWIGHRVGYKIPNLVNWLPLIWGITYVLTLWLLAGGFGLRPVSTNDWGGLALTLFMAVSSIVLCFPAGVLLALGRRSDLPMIRGICTAFIELVRGVPLIAWLFIGKFIFPDFLPIGSPTPNNLLRAIVVLAMFSAAYLAENIRGGLQSIPRGQTEAAQALGLNPLLTTILIILPQALKISIPAIVGQFISLFQDTTLLYIVDVQELLGMANAVLANPEFLGRRGEVYLFIGIIYWVCCYAMSVGSRRLEQQMNTSR